MRILRRDGSLCAELKADRHGNLHGAFLYEADLANAVLERVGFAGAELGRANIEGASLRGADLYWADCADANFTSADLQWVDFRGANLTNAVFRGSNIDGANLGLDELKGRTRLQGADLSGASVKGTSFEGAAYDDRTRFPDGFDPGEHKMTRVG